MPICVHNLYHTEHYLNQCHWLFILSIQQISQRTLFEQVSVAFYLIYTTNITQNITWTSVIGCLSDLFNKYHTEHYLNKCQWLFIWFLQQCNNTSNTPRSRIASNKITKFSKNVSTNFDHVFVTSRSLQCLHRSHKRKCHQQLDNYTTLSKSLSSYVVNMQQCISWLSIHRN